MMEPALPVKTKKPHTDRTPIFIMLFLTLLLLAMCTRQHVRCREGRGS